MRHAGTLKVSTRSGQASLLRGRIGFVISCAAFFLGVIWAAFDAQMQGWHDKIAGTYVVRA